MPHPPLADWVVQRDARNGGCGLPKPPKRGEMSVELSREDLLRRLSLNDEAALESIVGPGIADIDTSELGAKTCALVRIGALVATASADASYQWAVEVALARGASEDEIVDVLLSVAPIVGAARVNAAAPGLATALGYEPELPRIH